jgi:hypothetical protein
MWLEKPSFTWAESGEVQSWALFTWAGRSQSFEPRLHGLGDVGLFFYRCPGDRGAGVSGTAGSDDRYPWVGTWGGRWGAKSAASEFDWCGIMDLCRVLNV